MPQCKVNSERIKNIPNKMIDEEEHNTDFSAENFLGAILRKEREVSRILGARRAKEDITKNESSTSSNGKKVLTEDLNCHEKTLEDEETMKYATKTGASISLKDTKPLKNDIEEQEKNSTYSWPPSSLKKRYTYEEISQKRYNKSDSSISSFFKNRMKNFYKFSATKTEANKEVTNDLTNATDLDKEEKISIVNNKPGSIILSKYFEEQSNNLTEITEAVTNDASANTSDTNIIEAISTTKTTETFPKEESKEDTNNTTATKNTIEVVSEVETFEISFKEEAEVEVNDPPPTSTTNHHKSHKDEMEDNPKTEEAEPFENTKVIDKNISEDDSIIEEQATTGPTSTENDEKIVKMEFHIPEDYNESNENINPTSAENNDKTIKIKLEDISKTEKAEPFENIEVIDKNISEDKTIIEEQATPDPTSAENDEKIVKIKSDPFHTSEDGNDNTNPTSKKEDENQMKIKLEPPCNSEDHTNKELNPTPTNIAEEEVKSTQDIMKIMTLNAIFSTSKEDMMQDPTKVKFTIPTSYITDAKVKKDDDQKEEEHIQSFRKRKIQIGTGALLPDVIRLGDYISGSRLPSKTFSSRCKDLKAMCRQSEECKVHISFKNLRNLSKKLNMIWSNPERFSRDWKTNKVLRTEKNAYLNLAINYPQLWKEVEQIKAEINTFNVSRVNLKTFKTKIKNLD